MIVTGFLGFLTIAQNGLNTTKQKQQNQQQNQQLYTIPKPYGYVNTTLQGFAKGIRHYSTDCSHSLTASALQKQTKILTEFILSKNLEPVYAYENLGENFIKKKILEDTKDLSGIYLILNKVTLDYYIGSASTNRIHKRFASHLVNFSGSKVLKNAVRKYKISEFAFLVLEIFPEVVNQENNRKLLNLEDFYLKSLLPNYNILTEAGSSFGYKHSELTRIKMKTNYSQERRDRIASLNKNKKLSNETIELIREKALNRKKSIYSEQALDNMRKVSKPIIVYNLDHTIYNKYPSVVATAKNFNCSIKTVQRALKSDSKLLKKN
jgi:group I intron endonuclease